MVAVGTGFPLELSSVKAGDHGLLIHCHIPIFLPGTKQGADKHLLNEWGEEKAAGQMETPLSPALQNEWLWKAGVAPELDLRGFGMVGEGRGCFLAQRDRDGLRIQVR